MAEESLIGRYARSMEWEAVDLGCPSAPSSKRSEIREMLNRFYRSNKKIKGNIFHAMQNIRADYLL
jgi:tRNA 2-thiocytidine biosynthesis protein TtcA